jgi:hypothetical protein
MFQILLRNFAGICFERAHWLSSRWPVEAKKSGALSNT